MESRDRRSAVSAVIDILRRLTRIVQIAPFVYLLVYSAYLLFSWIVPDGILGLLDSVVFISPATSGGMLVISRLLKLCKWHRTAVLIPLSSQIEGYVDSFVFTFTECEITIMNTIIGILAFAFVIMAFKHFFHDGRKGNPIRDPGLLQVQG